MQLTVLLCLFLFALASAQGPPNPPSPDVYWFTQTFDHFNASDTRTYQERYLVYDKYFDGTGPVFFTPGGEADVFGGYNHNGFMFELGEKVGALLLFPEHRFYGKSVPYGMDSYQPHNIDKLTVEQALEDFKIIIRYVRNKWKVSDDAPLITFGGSYPGELAAFLRISAPDMVDGALAASAPLRYHSGLTQSGDFFQVCTKDFSSKNETCPDLVREAFNRMDQLAQTAEGRNQLSDELRLCTPIKNNGDDLRLIALWVENAFAELGMGNYPWPNGGLPPFPMEAGCEIMRSDYTPQKSIINLANTLKLAYNVTGDAPCYDISKEYYRCADITGCGGGDGDPDAMSWDYQSCTQLIANVDTNGMTDMFPSAPYDFASLSSYCQKKWNATPNPLGLFEKYDYTKSSRIIFSNGLLDPWYPGGILEGSPSKEIYSIQIELAAHHLDLRGTAPSDPVFVIQARAQEDAIILKWLKDARNERKSRRVFKQVERY